MHSLENVVRKKTLLILVNILSILISCRRFRCMAAWLSTRSQKVLAGFSFAFSSRKSLITLLLFEVPWSKFKLGLGIEENCEFENVKCKFIQKAGKNWYLASVSILKQCYSCRVKIILKFWPQKEKARNESTFKYALGSFLLECISFSWYYHHSPFKETIMFTNRWRWVLFSLSFKKMTQYL